MGKKIRDYFLLQRFFSKIFLFFNFLAAFSVGLSYLSIYVSPEKAWILAFFGLAYPYILLANLFFIIIWIISRKLWFLLSVSFILLGANHFNDFIQINTFSEKVKLSEPLKIMSYNVRLFDLYNWGKNWSYNKINRNNIYALLKQEQPDIICFQEYFSDSAGNFNSADSIVKFLKAKYYHEHFNVFNKDNCFGLATFSVFPIVGQNTIKFPKSKNLTIYTDLKVGEDTIRVFNIHLESIHFQKDDYNFVDSILDPEKEQISRSKKIYRKLRSAFKKRSHQADMVAAVIAKSPYPVFACGDFNDSPVSYAYHKVRGSLQDAFEESGNGVGNTYRGLLYSLRIDFILHTNSIKVTGYNTLQVDYSDHYPVSCMFELQKK